MLFQVIVAEFRLNGVRAEQGVRHKGTRQPTATLLRVTTAMTTKTIRLMAITKRINYYNYQHEIVHRSTKLKTHINTRER